MKSPLALIISREYLERVKRKSFIISTLLTPLFMIAVMTIPALIAIFSEADKQNIGVVDLSEQHIGRKLEKAGEISFTDAGTDLKAAMGNEEYDCVLLIPEDAVSSPAGIALYSHEAASMQSEAAISSQLENIIEKERIKGYNIDNLAQIMKEVSVDVNLETYRITDEENASETSSIASYLIGLMVSLTLYMFIMLYGQMVTTSIIDEKSNRVLEIVVSSVSPNALMMGKIVGIGLVAITQIVIWGLLVTGSSFWLMPMVTSAAAGTGLDLGMLGSPWYIAELFGYITLFLIGGYLFYSSIYAAVGSAVDNIQDASQLLTIAVVPIILGLMLSMQAAQNPSSGLAVWASMIPLTSPMVMMSRIPFGIPTWQIWVSLGVLYLSFVGMVWVAAKIYRVGIFMYGKKPTVAELIRWARYK